MYWRNSGLKFIWEKCLICLDFLPFLSSGEICQCVLSNLSWILWYMWCRHPRWIWVYSHFGTRRWCYQCCRTSSFHFSIRRSYFEGKKKSFTIQTCNAIFFQSIFLAHDNSAVIFSKTRGYFIRLSDQWKLNRNIGFFV